MSILNIAAGIVGLLVTVMLEILRHDRLDKDSKNNATIAELIRYNWTRTLSISAQSVISFLMLCYVFGVALPHNC